ncbi:hypothetical protein, partial [Micromonospora sp. CPCC 205561]|uniref:hypothetical protein n=1 Tax=Micromonospora sp. CPCC 205561 TaxID=3122407 RepID=UPI002FEF3E02
RDGVRLLGRVPARHVDERAQLNSHRSSSVGVRVGRLNATSAAIRMSGEWTRAIRTSSSAGPPLASGNRQGKEARDQRQLPPARSARCS